jgi:16S rRNA (adenine1518-N6/adenine1519-N6)-dimethyltransferase
VRPRKRFAQHFLEPAWVQKLVAAIDPSPADRFIEIGPGKGALTAALAARVDRVRAIEIDRDLAAGLAARRLANVQVVTADVLTVDLAEVASELSPDRAVRVVGNLPYNISSPILFRLLDASATGRLHDAVLMLQREVADRLVASPGTGDYGVLTISTGLGADVTRLLNLPPGAFRPAPRVRSAVVRLVFRPAPAGVRDPARVVAIVRAIFTQRRKMLANALASLAAERSVSAVTALEQAGIDPKRRPETLGLHELARLSDVLFPPESH